MDGPSGTVNPACVRSCRAQTSKGLGKTHRRVQALLRDSAGREPSNSALTGQLEQSNTEMQMLSSWLIHTSGGINGTLVVTLPGAGPPRWPSG